jgi:hypothetical protein
MLFTEAPWLEPHGSEVSDRTPLRGPVCQAAPRPHEVEERCSAVACIASCQRPIGALIGKHRGAGRERRRRISKPLCRTSAAYQSAYQPVHPRKSLSGRSRTVTTLDSHRASIPAVDGMEEVRGSSPLSSTAKVLVSNWPPLRWRIGMAGRLGCGCVRAGCRGGWRI